jgi:hypothetical protein
VTVSADRGVDVLAGGARQLHRLGQTGDRLTARAGVQVVAGRHDEHGFARVAVDAVTVQILELEIRPVIGARVEGGVERPAIAGDDAVPVIVDVRRLHRRRGREGGGRRREHDPSAHPCSVHGPSCESSVTAAGQHRNHPLG